MKTFEYIVERVLNLDEKNNKQNMFSAAFENAFQKLTFQRLLNTIRQTTFETEQRRIKMHFFFETIHDFYFSTKEKERTEFIFYFSKVQHVYNVFRRLAFRYKWKKANLSVTTDLQLNEIALGQRNVMCIYHANSKFLFRLEDLLKIVYTSLTNTYMFFSEPLTIKNPYNNISFGKSILYYIHYFLVTHADIGYVNYEQMNVFSKFRQHHFDLSRFIDMNVALLREHAIQNYMTNSTKTQLHNDIVHLIKLFNAGKEFAHKILIDIEFPVDTLITVMKPYLTLYLQSVYALTLSAQQSARQKMDNKLKLFQQFNPGFGKRNVVFKYVFAQGAMKRIKSHIEFNCKYRPFSQSDNSHFLSNHETYIYSEENDTMEGDIGNIYFAEND